MFFHKACVGLTGASQKIASLVATANQAQFQTQTGSPVTFVQNFDGTHHVIVTTGSTGECGQFTIIPQAAHVPNQPASSGYPGQASAVQLNQASQPSQFIQQNMYQQQMIVQKPAGANQQLQQLQSGWGSEDKKPILHALVSSSRAYIL